MDCPGFCAFVGKLADPLCPGSFIEELPVVAAAGVTTDQCWSMLSDMGKQELPDWQQTLHNLHARLKLICETERVEGFAGELPGQTLPHVRIDLM